MLTREAVINAFNYWYEIAQGKRWIKKKLAWALYQTWKWCDAEEEDNADTDH